MLGFYEDPYSSMYSNRLRKAALERERYEEQRRMELRRQSMLQRKQQEQEWLKQQQKQEWLRQQKEKEWLRQQREQELLRHNQEQEWLRQQQEQDRKQRAIRRARMEQQERRKRQEEDMRLRDYYNLNHRYSGGATSVVRGPDGRLYRVLHRDDSNSASSNENSSEKSGASVAKRTPLTTVVSSYPNVDSQDAPGKHGQVKETKSAQDIIRDEENIGTLHACVEEQPKISVQELNSVEAEDASDDEEESPQEVWQPAEGESWMEPVDT